MTSGTTALFGLLAVREGAAIDFRAPEAIRIGLSPLPTSFTEV